MRASALARIQGHRVWPSPARPWVMRQTWHALLFAHWPVAPDALRPHLPAGLALDTFAGRAWVGIVPFWMSGIRPRGMPAPPVLSRLDEINVRTYVTTEGKPGVWFYSLDAGRALAVAVARGVFHLPYYHARFSIHRAGETIVYASRRLAPATPHAAFRATYCPTGPVFTPEPGTLEHWLTERYCLYTTDTHGRLLRGDIHHAPWPLQAAEAEIAERTLARAAGIALPDTPPLLHYAARQEVLIWPLARAATRDVRLGADR